MDRGASFDTPNVGLSDQTPYAIGISPSFSADKTLFTGTERGVFRSTDAGASWRSFAEVTGLIDMYSLAVSPGYPRDRTVLAGGGGIVRTTNAGVTWTRDTTLWDVRSLALAPDFETSRIAFAGAFNNDYMDPKKGVWRSTNGGANWTLVSDGGGEIPTDRTVTGLAVSPAFSADHTVFAATNVQVYKSTDSGLSWAIKPVAGGSGFQCIAVSPNFANDRTVLAGSAQNGILISTDGGENWAAYNDTTLTSTASVLSVAFSPGYAADGIVYAGTGAGLLARAKGTGWSHVQVKNNATGFYSVALSPAYRSDGVAFAGSDGLGITQPGEPPTPIVKPAAPVWTTPAEGESGLSATPLLDWASVSTSPVVDAYEVAVYDGRNELQSSLTTTATEWTFPAGKLLDHRAYYATVRAHNANGWSPQAVRTFVVGTPPPAPVAPALVSPADGATGLSTAPTLDWSDVDPGYGIDWYKVRVFDGAGTLLYSAMPTGSADAVPSGTLESGREYYWDVLSHNALGYSAPSELRGFLAGTPPATVPSAPVPLSPGPEATWVVAQPSFMWRLNSAADKVDFYWVEVYDAAGNLATAGMSSKYFWGVPDAERLGDGLYSWRVFAHNYTGWSAASLESWFWVGRPPLTAPAAPALIAPADNSTGYSPNSVALDWADSPSAKEVDWYYVALWDIEGNLVAEKTTTSSTWSVPAGTLTDGAWYAWSAWAHNEAGWSEAGTYNWFSTRYIPAPPAPSGLYPEFASIVYDTRPTLSWYDGGAAYDIDGSWIEIYDDYGTLVYSGACPSGMFTVPAGVMQTGNWYWWSVSSHNVRGWSDYSERGCIGVSPPPPPATPYLAAPAVDALNVSLTGLKLDWYDVNGADRYYVMLTDDACNEIAGKWVTASEWTIPSNMLANGRWYGWAVWASNEGGDSFASEYRWFRAGTPPAAPAAPVLYSPSANEAWVDQSPFMDWSTVSGATSYDVVVWEKSGNVAASAQVTKSEWWVPIGKLKPSTRYYWGVWANNAGGQSPDGEWRSFVAWGPVTVKSVRTGVAALAVDPEPPGVILNTSADALDAVADADVGADATLAVGVKGTGGYTGATPLSVSGLPAGASAVFSANPVSAGATSTLSIDVGSVAEGVYPLVISARGGLAQAEKTVALRVFRSTSAGFTLGVVQESRVTSPGGLPVSYDVNVATQPGFAGAVGLSVTGLPLGATARFLPASVSGSGSSVLTVETAAATPVGTYMLGVNGTGAGRRSTAWARLEVSAPGTRALVLSSVEPTAVAAQGNEADWQVRLSATGGLDLPARVSVRGLPDGSSARWLVGGQSGVTASRGATATVQPGESATLVVSVPRAALKQKYPLVVAAVVGSKRATLPLELRVVQERALPTALSATPSTRGPVSYGGSVRFTIKPSANGVVQNTGTVALWRSTDGGLTWTKDGVGAYSSSAGGFVVTSKALTANTTFSARYSGNEKSLAAMSTPQVVTAKAKVSGPYAPKKVKRKKSFTVYGYLAPKHTDYRSTKIYLYRYSSGRWRAYGTYRYPSLSSYSSTSTKYSKKIALPYKGKWRIRVVHSDSTHYKTESSYRNVTAK